MRWADRGGLRSVGLAWLACLTRIPTGQDGAVPGIPPFGSVSMAGTGKAPGVCLDLADAGVGAGAGANVAHPLLRWMRSRGRVAATIRSQSRPHWFTSNPSCVREPADLRQKHPIHPQSRSRSFPSLPFHPRNFNCRCCPSSLSLSLSLSCCIPFILKLTAQTNLLIRQLPHLGRLSLDLTIAIAATAGELTYSWSVNPHPTTVDLFISGLDSRGLSTKPTDRAPPSYFRTTPGSGDHLSTPTSIHPGRSFPIPSSPKHQPILSSPLSPVTIGFQSRPLRLRFRLRLRHCLRLCAPFSPSASRHLSPAVPWPASTPR